MYKIFKINSKKFRQQIYCNKKISLKISTSTVLRAVLATVFLAAHTVLRGVSARKLDDIYWNSSNTMFDISNTEHVKQVELLDQVTLVCPTATNSHFRYEFSKLFLVSREGYDNCELREERQLGVCATPQRQSTIGIVFRPFSVTTPLLQFQPGQSYYVITTSDGTETGLNKTAGGLCLTRNMKIKFDVFKDYSRSETTQKPLAYSSLPPGVSEFDSIVYEIHTAPPYSIFEGSRTSQQLGTRSDDEDDSNSATTLSTSNLWAKMFFVAIFKLIFSRIIL